MGLGEVCSSWLGVQGSGPGSGAHSVCDLGQVPSFLPLPPNHWPVLRGDGPPQEGRTVVPAITDIRWRKGPLAGGICGPQLPGLPLVATSQH